MEEAYLVCFGFGISYGLIMLSANVNKIVRQHYHILCDPITARDFSTCSVHMINEILLDNGTGEVRTNLLTH